MLFCRPFLGISKLLICLLLERRLDDQNYDSLSKSTKQKEETKKQNDDVNDVSITDIKLDAVVETGINKSNDDTG